MDAPFQWRFVFSFVAVSLLGSMLSNGIFNYYALQKLDELKWSVHVGANAINNALHPLLLSFSLLNVFLVSILLALTAWLMLRKIKAPLQKIMQELERLESGDFSREITLRRNEPFQEVAAELNEMTKAMKGKFSMLKTEYIAIAASMEELMVADFGEDSSRQAASQLHSQVQSLTAKLAVRPTNR